MPKHQYRVLSVKKAGFEKIIGVPIIFCLFERLPIEYL
jgi:hypothetical protein